MSKFFQAANDGRLVLTTDNDNLDISSVIALAETDGTLKVSVNSAGAAVGKLLAQDDATPVQAAVYTVPASKRAVIEKIVMLNRDSVIRSVVFLGVSIGGGALGNADLLAADKYIGPNQSLIWTGDLYLAATDEIRFVDSSSQIGIQIWGYEIDV